MRAAFDRELTREQRLLGAWQQHGATDLLPEAARLALIEWLLRSDSINKSAYAELCDVSPATASKHLSALTERGLLQQTGKGPSTRYLLSRLTPVRRVRSCSHRFLPASRAKQLHAQGSTAAGGATGTRQATVSCNASARVCTRGQPRGRIVIVLKRPGACVWNRADRVHRAKGSTLRLRPMAQPASQARRRHR